VLRYVNFDKGTLLKLVERGVDVDSFVLRAKDNCT
jgi:hypothetical protein